MTKEINKGDCIINETLADHAARREDDDLTRIEVRDFMSRWVDLMSDHFFMNLPPVLISSDYTLRHVAKYFYGRDGLALRWHVSISIPAFAGGRKNKSLPKAIILRELALELARLKEETETGHYPGDRGRCLSSRLRSWLAGIGIPITVDDRGRRDEWLPADPQGKFAKLLESGNIDPSPLWTMLPKEEVLATPAKMAYRPYRCNCTRAYLLADITDGLDIRCPRCHEPFVPAPGAASDRNDAAFYQALAGVDTDHLIEAVKRFYRDKNYRKWIGAASMRPQIALPLSDEERSLSLLLAAVQLWNAEQMDLAGTIPLCSSVPRKRPSSD